MKTMRQKRPRPEEHYTAGYRLFCSELSELVWKYKGVFRAIEFVNRTHAINPGMGFSPTPFGVGYRHATEEFLQSPFAFLFLKPPQAMPPQEASRS